MGWVALMELTETVAAAQRMPSFHFKTERLKRIKRISRRAPFYILNVKVQTHPIAISSLLVGGGGALLA